jgi:hypothetical protein
MSKADKTLEKVMSGTSDANIRFDDLCHLLVRLGWDMRQGKGSHVTFLKGAKFLNLQDRGGKVQPYQVRQVREQLSQP